ncbi:MAG: hypothetical protein ACI35S_03155 [Anaeroplasma sp.]
MKKILNLFLFVVILFSLTSCISNENIEYHTLDYVYNENDTEIITLKQAEINSLIENNGSFDRFYDLFNDVESHIMEIATYSNIEYLKYSINGDLEAQSKYAKFSELLNNYLKWEKELFNMVYDSPFKERFFAGLTEEQIREYLSETYDDEFYILQNETDEIIQNYSILTEDEVLEKTPDIYVSLVNKYNKMAKYAGYDDYLTYAYKEIYSRDYTPSETVDFVNNVKKYIVPAFFDAYERFQKESMNISFKNSTKINSLIYGSFLNNKAIVDKYAKRIGGTYYLNYMGLWDNGYYFMSNDSKATNGAYTCYLYSLDTPAVYFGPDYQNISTVVHEFGHYYSMKCQNGSVGSFDLAETHSQSDEFLFLAYLEQEGGYISSVTDIIKLYNYVQALSSIILSAVVNEFEYKVYTSTNLVASNLDSLVVQIFDEFGGYSNYENLFGMDPKDYWKYVAVENAGYYISYAVSLIPSMSIYKIASEDFDNARNAYLDICNYPSMNENFLEIITSAGLSSPFIEESFKNVSTMI